MRNAIIAAIVAAIVSALPASAGYNVNREIERLHREDNQLHYQIQRLECHVKWGYKNTVVRNCLERLALGSPYVEQG